MRIDGREIARQIFEDLKKRVENLKKEGVTPHLAIIQIGDDPASLAYVGQKEKKSAEIGARTTLFHFPFTVSQSKLLSTIEQLNNDNNVHGIIVQRPLPKHIDGNKINLATDPQKDIDAFNPQTPFSMPLAAAVLKVLEEICKQLKQSDFIAWLTTKNIVVMGKGETGGGPVIANLRKLGAQPHIIDSKTQNPQLLTKQADIIVAAIGKSNILTSSMIKKGVILLAVGMYKGMDGKLHGDYEEEQIKDIASFYTPIPGGVGPVNVAMLLQNLVDSAEKNTKIYPLDKG